MKALIIKIRDAGVFKPPTISGSQDKVPNLDGTYTSRFNKGDKSHTPYFKIPAGQLYHKHVANLLRVLFGQRPVPSLREVHASFTGDPYYEELAKRVRVKIESPVMLVSPGDKVHKDPYYPEETTTVRKSIGDSWQTATRPYFLDGKFVQVKGGLLYHDRLHRYLGNDLFSQFTTLVKQYGVCDTVQEAVELLNVHKNETPIINFCKNCEENSRKSLSNMILNNKVESNTMHTTSGKSPLNIIMTMGGVQTLEKFSATLYVPVSDEDLMKIDAGPGVATYLEGGYAKIDGVEDWSELIELDTTETVEAEYVCHKDS